MKLIDLIVKQSASMVALRRDLHAHPELGFALQRTSDLVASQLTQWDIPVHRGLGRTGVVGIIRHGTSARAIGLRADMDALPIQEANTFAHASAHPGLMHACGHDGHMAMLLSAAHYLVTQPHFDGTVYLVFQPAEEGGGGAHEMIKDGLFDLFPMDAVFGMHNWPGLPEGQFAVSEGPVMASSNEFKITLHGKGGHAAMPHKTQDPVPVACQLVQAFQTIISRNLRPIDAGVISVSSIHTGQTNNVILGRCVLAGTVRSLLPEVLDLIEHRMQGITRGVCEAFEMAHDFEFTRNYPATVNHAAESDLARQVLTDIVGQSKVLAQEPTMAAEDFAYMLQARPGCYVFIGNGDDDHGGGSCMLHNACYDFNDALLPLGATYWVRLAERYLQP